MNKKMQKRELSKYTMHWNRFVSIYTIIISIIWMIFIVSMFYTNKDSNTEESWIISVFLLFWCFILGLWIYMLIKTIKQKILKERLFQEWNRLIATVTDFESVGMMFKFWEFTIMWRWSWFKIHAKYEYNHFISPKIWINVPKYVKIWDKIPVFINMYNPEEYYMDLHNINSI